MKDNDEKGQALLELIIFLPLMFTVYAIITGFANAIYGSINQQKATRAYFYYRVQNNSTIPRRPSEGVDWTKYGAFFIGWRESVVEGDRPLYPCYKISIPVSGAANDDCSKEYTASEGSRPSTQYMRVGTVYGVCGATYLRDSDGVYLLPNHPTANFFSLLDSSSCVIQ